jgi:hypothetical protein
MEVTHGSGGRVGTAGNVLLAALVEDILSGDSDEDGNCGIISMRVNSIVNMWDIL